MKVSNDVAMDFDTLKGTYRNSLQKQMLSLMKKIVKNGKDIYESHLLLVKGPFTKFLSGKRLPARKSQFNYLMV